MNKYFVKLNFRDAVHRIAALARELDANKISKITFVVV
jgi:hypothetical protein